MVDTAMDLTLTDTVMTVSSTDPTEEQRPSSCKNVGFLPREESESEELPGVGGEAAKLAADSSDSRDTSGVDVSTAGGFAKLLEQQTLLNHLLGAAHERELAEVQAEITRLRAQISSCSATTDSGRASSKVIVEEGQSTPTTHVAPPPFPFQPVDAPSRPPVSSTPKATSSALSSASSSRNTSVSGTTERPDPRTLRRARRARTGSASPDDCIREADTTGKRESIVERFSRLKRSQTEASLRRILPDSPDIPNDSKLPESSIGYSMLKDAYNAASARQSIAYGLDTRQSIAHGLDSQRETPRETPRATMQRPIYGRSASSASLGFPTSSRGVVVESSTPMGGEWTVNSFPSTNTTAKERQSVLSIRSLYSVPKTTAACDSDDLVRYGSLKSETWFSSPSADRESEDGNSKVFHVTPWPVWGEIQGLQAHQGQPNFHHLRGRCLQKLDSSDILELQKSHLIEHCLQSMVLLPGGLFRSAWLFIGAGLISCDLIMLPMSVFEFAEEGYDKTVTITSLVFWTLDFIMSFLVGYVNNGTIEMRWEKAAKRYVRTRMTLDLSLVVADWLASWHGNMMMWKHICKLSVALIRAPKTFVIAHNMGSIRILYAAFLPESIRETGMLLMRSEYTSICVGLVKHMLCILLINHFIACLWTYIGQREPDAWVGKYMQADDEWVMVYLTALHWSLTQFTPATMSVQPTNLVERAFAVLVLLFAMITFSSFVSSITNLMTGLRSMRSVETKRFMQLERFLDDHNITFPLCVKLRRYLEHVIDEQQKRPNEQHVPLLKSLSQPLLQELHYELYSPGMLVHPFFEQLTLISRTSLQKICHSALTTIDLFPDDVLFDSGEAAKEMYFMTKGVARYTRPHDTKPVFVHKGEWMSEMVLWFRWLHQGSFTVTEDTSLTALYAKSFHEIIHDSVAGSKEAAAYAFAAAEHMTEVGVEGDFSDLNGTTIEASKLTAVVFGLTKAPKASDVSDGGFFSDVFHRVASAHRRRSTRRSTCKSAFEDISKVPEHDEHSD